MMFGGGNGGQAAKGSAGSASRQKAPDDPWIVRDGRFVPSPNWVNPWPNLEKHLAIGIPLTAGAGALLTLPRIYGLTRPDLFRYSPETRIPNVLVTGPGAPGITKGPAVKGGGPKMPFHYHIHRYNWYKPHTWFRPTKAIKEGKAPR